MSQPRVCSFESRRAEDIARLVTRFGGIPRVAPSMREIAIEDNPRAGECIQALIAGEFELVILLTGVGTEALFEIARRNACEDQLREALRQTRLVVRGPKPAAVLHRTGLSYDLKAPEPNTWRELLAVLDDSDIAVDGCRVAVQEYGQPNEELNAALAHRGARVTSVPVYRWGLPEDLEPLQEAIRQIAAGQQDVVLFTSAQQVVHVLQIAGEEGLEQALRQALAAVVVASVGPTCSESLRQHGLPVHVEASPPKMAPLVRQAVDCFRERAAAGSA